MKLTALSLALVFSCVYSMAADEPKYPSVNFTNNCLRKVEVTKIRYLVDGDLSEYTPAANERSFGFRQTRNYAIPHNTMEKVIVVSSTDRACFTYQSQPKPVAQSVVCGRIRVGYSVYLQADRKGAEIRYAGRPIQYGKLYCNEDESGEGGADAAAASSEAAPSLYCSTKGGIADAGYSVGFSPELNPATAEVNQVSATGEKRLALLGCRLRF